MSLFQKSAEKKYLNELDFSVFLKELKKAKMSFGLSEEVEWMKYFNNEKAKMLALQSDIDQTDNKIDQIIYLLYGLSEEEIIIVEGTN